MTIDCDHLPALGVRTQPQSPAHIGADRTERETIQHRVRMFLDGGCTYLEALHRAYLPTLGVRRQPQSPAHIEQGDDEFGIGMKWWR